MEQLEHACAVYIDWLQSSDYNEDEISDYEHEIFSLALELCQGKEGVTCG